MEPDIAGYEAAQANLRAKMGREVPFFTPTPTVWPEDIPVDAEGRPLDPTVAPLASGFASAAVNCNVAVRSTHGLQYEAPQLDGPIGKVGYRSVMLIMDAGDFPTVKDATECEVFGRRYKIEADRPDQVGGANIQRWLVFAEEK